MQLKNITWSDLLNSKTFRATAVLAVQQALQAFMTYRVSHDGLTLANTLVAITAGVMVAVGLIDRTATPNVSQG